MIINIIISIIFLLLLGLTIINGRYAKAGIGEKPLMYTSSYVQFFLNVSLLVFIGLSLFLLFFYSWKLFLILILVGFITESLVIVPIIERGLALIINKIITKAEKNMSKEPKLKKEEIPNFERVNEFVAWFIKNDSIANTISGISSNIIFNEGSRPLTGAGNDPESFKQDINNLAEWFTIKIFIDLNNSLKDIKKDEFEKFIDLLDETSMETLVAYGDIGIKYDFDMDHFVYEKEIKKIPDGWERVLFKTNFLSDNVLAAEMRILAWLYHDYFGEWYKPKNNK